MARASTEKTYILAAASLEPVINALLEPQARDTIVFISGSSGALARQIQQGVPVDLYISANAKWARWLEEQRPPQHTATFTENSLALVALAEKQLPPPRDDSLEAALEACRPLASTEPALAPAGEYAEQALAHYNLLDEYRPHMVLFPTVRSATLAVLLKELPCGIIYNSDCVVHRDKLVLRFAFSPSTHAPIRYFALIYSESGRRTMDQFQSPQAQEKLGMFGFSAPTRSSCPAAPPTASSNR